MTKNTSLLLTIILLFTNISANCQVGDTSQLADIDQIEKGVLRLPPLGIFLDAAANYSEVRFFEAKRDEANLQSKVVKRDWLSYFRLQGNYQYGTNNSYLSQYGDEYIDWTDRSAQQTQSWYSAGASVSIPLNDLLSRKQKVGITKSRSLQADFEAEKALEDRKLIILQTYNEILKQLAILKVKSESVALYNAQMHLSENDFINGKIDVISLSLERGRRAVAMVDYQESRAALHSAVTQLEMLTGIKIIRQ